MSSVQRGPLLAVLGQLAVLAALGAVVDIDVAGWVAGLLYGTALAVLLQLALVHREQNNLGPADWVTLVRAVLVGAVAAVAVGDSSQSRSLLAGLVIAALVLDGVDGQVARRTGTCSELGARFDMEVDAFLILVLSGLAARQLGWWVLLIGLARYAFVAAMWRAPWLRRPLPYRYWRKVVAAMQGIALLIAVSQLLPPRASALIVGFAGALLAESFGRDVLWLWSKRRDPANAARTPAVLRSTLSDRS